MNQNLLNLITNGSNRIVVVFLTRTISLREGAVSKEEVKTVDKQLARLLIERMIFKSDETIAADRIPL